MITSDGQHVFGNTTDKGYFVFGRVSVDGRSYAPKFDFPCSGGMVSTINALVSVVVDTGASLAGMISGKLITETDYIATAANRLVARTPRAYSFARSATTKLFKRTGA